jgi:hypothetical protein
MYDNNFQVEGTIKDRFEMVQVSDKFRKREFILSVNRAEDSKVELIKFQCLNAKVDLVDEIRIGNRVIVEFRLSGRKWEKDGEKEVYFTNLDCTGVEVIDPTNLEEPDPNQGVIYSDQLNPAQHLPPKDDILKSDDEYSDLPFIITILISVSFLIQYLI